MLQVQQATYSYWLYVLLDFKEKYSAKILKDISMECMERL